jgi:hypothetical protein
MTHDRSAQLLALAAKVEALKGPDREVDDAIIDAFGWRNDFGVPIPPGFIGVPNYTGSVDHAAKLVPTTPFPQLRPGEWWWSVDSLGCDAHVAYENHDSGIPEYSARAETPALALCAAALRARAELTKDNPHAG